MNFFIRISLFIALALLVLQVTVAQRPQFMRNPYATARAPTHYPPMSRNHYYASRASVYGNNNPSAYRNQVQPPQVIRYAHYPTNGASSRLVPLIVAARPTFHPRHPPTTVSFTDAPLVAGNNGAHSATGFAPAVNGTFNATALTLSSTANSPMMNGSSVNAAPALSLSSSNPAPALSLSSSNSAPALSLSSSNSAPSVASGSVNSANAVAQPTTSSNTLSSPNSPVSPTSMPALSSATSVATGDVTSAEQPAGEGFSSS